MTKYIVLGQPLRSYIIRNNTTCINRQTENREKTVMSITEAILFPDGSLGTIIQIFKYILVAVQYSIINEDSIIQYSNIYLLTSYYNTLGHSM